MATHDQFILRTRETREAEEAEAARTSGPTVGGLTRASAP